MCKKLKGIHNRIDKCMKNFIKFLKNACDVKVVACCCGHGKYPMTIVAKFNNDIQPYVEIVSGISIPRKRNFYKKDKQGYYFIPEVENGN